jgi:hypothetical protein
MGLILMIRPKPLNGRNVRVALGMPSKRPWRISNAVVAVLFSDDC